MKSISENLCPFCKQDNHCQARKDTPCWCGNLTFPADLLALLPEEQKMKSCICRSCILAYQEDPEAFAKAYTPAN